MTTKRAEQQIFLDTNILVRANVATAPDHLQVIALLRVLLKRTISHGYSSALLVITSQRQPHTISQRIGGGKIASSCYNISTFLLRDLVGAKIYGQTLFDSRAT